MTGGGGRPRRLGRIDGAPWTLYDAGRARSGLGLGYFVSDDGEADDRRTALPSGLDLAVLDDDVFRELWEAGRGITCTERRVIDGSGAIWLAQSVGPVWAEGGSAAGTVGIRMRCISADLPVVELHGARLPDLSDADLIARAGAPEGAAPSSD